MFTFSLLFGCACLLIQYAPRYPPVLKDFDPNKLRKILEYNLDFENHNRECSMESRNFFALFVFEHCLAFFQSFIFSLVYRKLNIDKKKNSFTNSGNVKKVHSLFPGKLKQFCILFLSCLFQYHPNLEG